MRIVNQIAFNQVARPGRWSFITLISLLSLSWSAQAQFYAVTDLGTLGGTNAMAYGVNNQEQIVGTAQTAMGNYHAFMFDGGRMLDLGTLGGSNSWAYGINDMGWMVGAAEMPMTSMHAFLCTNLVNNPMMDMGTLGGSNSAAWMIDMHGDIVGWAAMTNGSHHAFFMTNSWMGNMMDLGTAGGTNSGAYCINSNRMVVGYTMMSNGDMESIMSTNALYGSSSMMTMGMGGMSGTSGGQSWSVNNMGQETGQAQMSGGNFHAFVSGTGGMMGSRTTVDLGTLGGTNSFAYCINDGGTVVGAAQMGNGVYHAFMVTNAMGGMVRMLDLNTLIPTNSGWDLMEARGVNAAGQIVGWGMHAGHTNSFLLTPVAGPTMITSAPGSEVASPGGMISLQMHMSASEPLTYQWLHNGMPIPGATNATLTLPATAMADAGRYTVMARNGVGTVASSSAVVGMFSLAMSNGMPRLTVAAPTGTQFRLDYSDMVGAAMNWQTLTNFTMFGATNEMKDTPPSGSRTRFFRAMMTP